MNIENIRKLVKLYYEGLTTPDQEKILYDYFSYTESSDIPEDMKGEATIFSALGGMSAEPPADLLSEIEKGVSAEKRSRRLHIWGLVSAGVAAAVIAAIFLLYPDSTKNSPEYSGITLAGPKITDTASTDSDLHEPEVSTDTITVEKTVSRESVVSKKMAYSKSGIQKQAHKTAKQADNQLNYNYDEYIVINDEETANRILDDISRRISNIMAKGIEAQEKIPDIDQLLTEKLNKI